MELELDNRLLVAVLVCIVGIFAFLVLTDSGPAENQVCFFVNSSSNESIKCVDVLIADNIKLQGKGLSGREALPEDEGMLFVFDKASQYSFWMKDMEFPIDIIWINSDKEVIDISEDLPICVEKKCKKYTPRDKVVYVVEVNANFSKTYDITNQSVVSFELPG